MLHGRVVDHDERPAAGALVVLSSHPLRTTVTAADGTFSFDALVASAYSVLARRNDAVAGPVEVPLFTGAPTVVLRLEQGSRVEVTVVDIESVPVAGARVTMDGALDEQTRIANESGSARFDGVPPSFAWLSAEAPGHAPAARSIEPSGRPGDALHVTLTLHAGASASGIVVDEAGARIEDATVCAEAHDPELTTDACAVSERDGRFRIAALAAGRWAFTATTAAHVPGHLDDVDLDGRTNRDDLVITMHAGTRLAGRVVDQRGAGVSGATVRVRADGLGHPLRAVISDDEGRFEMRGLPREPIDAVAERGSASSAITSVDLSSDPGHAGVVEVVLTAIERKVSGRVLTSSGEPVAGAHLTAFPALHGTAFDRVDRLFGRPSASTDAAGRFELGPMAPGKWGINVTPRGPESFGDGLEETHWITAPTSEDLRFVLDPRGAITGRASAPGGSPQDPVTVVLSSDEEAFATDPSRAFSGTGGVFAVDGVPSRTYFMTLLAPGFPAKKVAGVTVRPGTTTDVGSIVLDAGRAVRARVIGADGRPVADARVVVAVYLSEDTDTDSASDDSPVHEEPEMRTLRGQGLATTGPDGRCTLTAMRTGELLALADHPERGRSRLVKIPAGMKDAEVTLALALAPRRKGPDGAGPRPAP